MPEGGDLPVEHRYHPGLFGIHDAVADPVIAVYDTGLVGLGNVGGQPLHERLHGGDSIGLRGLVLLGPARNLARIVVARAAETLEAQRQGIEAVDRSQRLHRVLEERSALFGTKTGEARVRDDASLHVLHHEEGGTDHRLVFAQQVGARHGYPGALQGTNHPVLSIHLVGGAQQHTRRLLAQYIALPSALQQVGGVALAALELAHLEGTFEAGHVVLEV